MSSPSRNPDEAEHDSPFASRLSVGAIPPDGGSCVSPTNADGSGHPSPKGWCTPPKSIDTRWLRSTTRSAQCRWLGLDDDVACHGGNGARRSAEVPPGIGPTGGPPF